MVGDDLKLLKENILMFFFFSLMYFKYWLRAVGTMGWTVYSWNSFAEVLMPWLSSSDCIWRIGSLQR